MQLNNLIQGLVILQKYYQDGNGHHNGAEHDIFYAYSTDQKMGKADIAKMIELGWFQENMSVDAPVEDNIKAYNKEEGWQAFM